MHLWRTLAVRRIKCTVHSRTLILFLGNFYKFRNDHLSTNAHSIRARLMGYVTKMKTFEVVIRYALKPFSDKLIYWLGYVAKMKTFEKICKPKSRARRIFNSSSVFCDHRNCLYR